MPVLIHYALADGQIQHVYEATAPEFLDWQYCDVAVSGALPMADTMGLAPAVLMERYVVDLATLSLVPKTAGTLTATPNPFPADGRAICAVTLTPFVPCSLRVGTEIVTLTVDDATLELTSDVAQVFDILLAPQPTTWAEPLTVEAV